MSPATKSSIQWVINPSALGKAIKKYGDRAKVAAHAVCAQAGAKMQNEARENALWEDRTGNARGGIFFAVDGFGVAPKTGTTEAGAPVPFRRDAREDKGAGGSAKTLVVVLGHTMFYGEYLELGMGGAYEIIYPTMLANVPELERALANLFKD